MGFEVICTEIRAHVCGLQDFDGEVLVHLADDLDGVADGEVGVLCVGDRDELVSVRAGGRGFGMGQEREGLLVPTNYLLCSDGR